MVNNGLLLVATGLDHRKMLQVCLTSIRKHEPDIPIEVFIDIYDDQLNQFSIIQKIIAKPTFSWDDKITAIENCNFDNFIYLDVDTLIIREFTSDLFDIITLDNVVVRSGMSFNLEYEKEQSPARTQYNTGVIVLNKKVAKTLARTWRHFREIELEQGFVSHDQPSFRISVLNLDLRVQELSSDFNFMGGFDGVIDKIRVLHFAGAPKKLYEFSKNEKYLKILRNAQSGSYFYNWRLLFIDRKFQFNTIIRGMIDYYFMKSKIIGYRFYKLLRH